MQSMADKAWQTAAEQAYDPTVRDLYRRMRDAWIVVADRYESLERGGCPA
jgi:hypothetical protein